MWKDNRQTQQRPPIVPTSPITRDTDPAFDHEPELLETPVTPLRILTGKKSTLKLNSSDYEKYEYGHLGRWHIKLILFKA